MTDSRTFPSRPSRILSNLRVVGVGILASRVLGMVRDMGMAALFGAGTTLDAFIVAFRIPNLTRQLFGEGALTTAFLPIFIRERDRQGDESARAMLTAVSIALTVALTAIVCVSELVAAGLLIGFNLAVSTRLLLHLLMLLLPYMVLICNAALLCAALHSMQRFFWPTIVPIALNALWLAGILLAWWLFDEEHSALRARSVALSITFAGFVQLLIPVAALSVLGMGFSRLWRRGWPRVGEVFRTMLPVVAGMSIMQINSVLDSFMAWGLARPDQGGTAWCEALGIPPLLESGTATALYIGQRMYQFPLGVIGVALGTVLYPVLSKHAQRGQSQALRDEICRGLRLVIAIAFPASAGLVVLAEPVTAVLFQHGAFTTDDARLSARMIAMYGAGVWTYIGLAVANRVFYALGDRVTPMRCGLIALALNIALNVVLVWSLGGIGLALASVLASIVQLGLTMFLLRRNVGEIDWRAIGITAGKGILATGVMVACCLLTLRLFGHPTALVVRIVWLACPLIVGLLSYIGTTWWLGMEEIRQLLRRREFES